ncbi:MAG: hypothetical protein GF335_00930 [Candidatus Moranbacteria bacterium]|nr:hypothetical protein [Candidatus Moranbacteria bacterium]
MKQKDIRFFSKVKKPQEGFSIGLGIIYIFLFLTLALVVLGSVIWYLKHKNNDFYRTFKNQENQDKNKLYDELNYINQRFGFSLQFTPAWKDYQIKVIFQDKNQDKNKEREFFEIKFFLPSKEAKNSDLQDFYNIWSILAFKVEPQEKDQKETKSKDLELIDKEKLESIETELGVEKIGSNQKYMFFSKVNKPLPNDIDPKALADINFIKQNFKTLKAQENSEDKDNAPSIPDQLDENINPKALESVEKQQNSNQKPLYNVSFASKSDYFFNCKYHYSFYIPSSWEIPEDSHYASNVKLYGSNINIEIESFELEKNQGLEEFALSESKKISDRLISKNKVDWSTKEAYVFKFKKSKAVFWIFNKDNQIFGQKMLISSRSYQGNNDLIDKILGTLVINQNYLAQCNE